MRWQTLQIFINKYVTRIDDFQFSLIHCSIPIVPSICALFVTVSVATKMCQYQVRSIQVPTIELVTKWSTVLQTTLVQVQTPTRTENTVLCFTKEDQTTLYLTWQVCTTCHVWIKNECRRQEIKYVWDTFVKHCIVYQGKRQVRIWNVTRAIIENNKIVSHITNGMYNGKIKSQ